MTHINLVVYVRISVGHYGVDKKRSSVEANARLLIPQEDKF